MKMCTACATGYVLNPAGSCLAATTCGDGNYYDPVQLTCLSCQQNCVKCSWSLSTVRCRYCASGYALTAGATCVQQNSTASGVVTPPKCPDFTFDNSTARTCQSCPDVNCRQCGIVNITGLPITFYCNLCVPQYAFDLVQQKCVQQTAASPCVAGTYPDAMGVCRPCP
jgi:hypothetical protein